MIRDEYTPLFDHIELHHGQLTPREEGLINTFALLKDGHEHLAAAYGDMLSTRLVQVMLAVKPMALLEMYPERDLMQFGDVINDFIEQICRGIDTYELSLSDTQFEDMLCHEILVKLLTVRKHIVHKHILEAHLTNSDHASHLKFRQQALCEQITACLPLFVRDVYRHLLCDTTPTLHRQLMDEDIVSTLSEGEVIHITPQDLSMSDVTLLVDNIRGSVIAKYLIKYHHEMNLTVSEHQMTLLQLINKGFGMFGDQSYLPLEFFTNDSTPYLDRIVNKDFIDLYSEASSPTITRMPIDFFDRKGFDAMTFLKVIATNHLSQIRNADRLKQIEAEVADALSEDPSLHLQALTVLAKNERLNDSAMRILCDYHRESMPGGARHWSKGALIEKSLEPANLDLFLHRFNDNWTLGDKVLEWLEDIEMRLKLPIDGLKTLFQRQQMRAIESISIPQPYGLQAEEDAELHALSCPAL